MNLPSGMVLEAIQRVAARPEGQLVGEFLRSQLDLTNQRLGLEQDAVALRTLQGHAQILTTLVKVWKP